MAKQLQLRKGTATEHNTFTGANGEVTVDTTNKTLRVHDGSTVGGTRLATLTGGLVPSAQLPAATTSTQGVVRLATESDITNSSETAVVTPKNVVDMFSAINSSSELISLPNGMIIKFNRFYFNTNGETVSFSDPFPNACLVCLIGAGEDLTGTAEVLNVISGSISKSGFRANATAATYYTYIAIGY